MSERQVYAVSGISTAVLVGGASRAVPPPAPGTDDVPLAQPHFGWHSFSSGAGPRSRTQAQHCSSVLCEHREGFSATDVASAKLSPESTQVTCHQSEAMPRPPRQAAGFLLATEQLFPTVHIKHREQRNKAKLTKMLFQK